MGPAHYGRGYRGGRIRHEPNVRREYVRSVRVGDVPMFHDRSDPKVYRRHLMDWIRFQDLATPDSSKKLSLGQQVFAIITNVQGNAGHRLQHVASMVHANITRDEFMAVSYTHLTLPTTSRV